MARVLFLFLDGVGLGDDNPRLNPLAAASMPELSEALEGRRLVRDAAPFEGALATLLAVDACLAVDGYPQSATGQAAILTGRNVPAEIGEHYGPKPNPAVAAIVQGGNLFMEVLRRGGRAALLNAYPPSYFKYIQSGRRLYSCIPLAATAAGLALRTAEDLQHERALSADFTGEGWALQPGFPPSPIYSPAEAGRRLAGLAAEVDLAWFDFWASDYAGHKGDWGMSMTLLESFDGVLGGLIEASRGGSNLIVLTSDHGNLEDSGRRGHTRNPVPALLIGPSESRGEFARDLKDLTGFHSAVVRAIFGEGATAGAAPT
jgi:hypothetical protein